MAAVKGKNTKPEVAICKLLHTQGYRFRLHRKDLPGKPDIVLPKYKTVIFINGCFWHQHEGCKQATIPATNREFWQTKLNSNKARDKRILQELQSLGWRVLTLWECEIKTILTQGFIPNLPPRDEARPAPETEPYLMAADKDYY